jgi:hypothetical protein
VVVASAYSMWSGFLYALFKPQGGNEDPGFNKDPQLFK